jgi:isopenicillin N synthase-like dioxygenase
MQQGRNIPIIDIAGLGAGNGAPEDEVIAAIAVQVRAACLEHGFFYLSGHGIGAELLAGVFEANRAFHARPLTEKLQIKLNQWHRGYQAFATSKLVSSARFAPASAANQLESFFLRHEVPPDDPGYRVRELMGPNQWPDGAAFRDAVSRYDRAVRELGMRLLPVFSLAVGERPAFFQQFFQAPSTALRLIHYPAAPGDREREVFGIHPHTDYGFITILAQDDVGGLEIQTVDGGWMPAPAIPGALIINIGDILARWTNEVFNSTPHRVINPSARRSRYSVGMFFDPDIDAHIRCLDQFTEGGQPVKHPPIRYGDYFQNRLDNNYPDRVGVVATTSL